MLPRVEIAYKYPAVAPEVFSDLIFNLTAKGDTIPRKRAGGVNRRIEAIMAIIFMLCIWLNNKLSNTPLRSAEKIMKMAATKMIRANTAYFGNASEIRPPI